MYKLNNLFVVCVVQGNLVEGLCGWVGGGWVEKWLISRSLQHGIFILFFIDLFPSIQLFFSWHSTV